MAVELNPRVRVWMDVSARVLFYPFGSDIFVKQLLCIVKNICFIRDTVAVG